MYRPLAPSSASSFLSTSIVPKQDRKVISRKIVCYCCYAKLILLQSKNVTAKCTETLSPPPSIQFSLSNMIIHVLQTVLHLNKKNICLMYNYRVHNNLFWIFLIQMECARLRSMYNQMVGRISPLFPTPCFQHR